MVKKTLIALLIILFLTTNAQAAWLGTWAKRIKIEVANTNVDAELSTFPLLVYVSASSGINSDDVSAVFDELTSDANRKKIAITSSDGTTEQYVEIEKWDDASEQAWLWAGVGTLSDSEVTTLYIYYDSSQDDNTDYVGDTNDVVAESVWDSNYIFVHHMNDGASTSATYDSTGTDLDGTKTAANNPVVNTGGIVGNCQSYDGGDDIDLGTSWSPTNPLTVQCAVKPTSTAIDQQFVSKGYDGSNTQWELKTTQATGEVSFRGWIGSAVGVESTNVVSTSAWTAWHGTFSSSPSNRWEVFYNGIPDGNVSNVVGIATTEAIMLGAISVNGSPGQWITGLLDECRGSDIDRTDQWIKADYNSIIDNLNDFYSEELKPSTRNRFITF